MGIVTDELLANKDAGVRIYIFAAFFFSFSFLFPPFLLVLFSFFPTLWCLLLLRAAPRLRRLPGEHWPRCKYPIVFTAPQLAPKQLDWKRFDTSI